jgi:putative salt-induced outer membrane protein YdiY
MSPLAHAADTGNWQGNVALAMSRAAGNTESTTYSAAVDEVRATPENKISAYLSALYGVSQGVKSADKARLGSRYDHFLSTNTFGFGLLEFENDRLANLNLRSGVGAGLGYYFVKEAAHSFDVFGGLSYTQSDLMLGNNTQGSEVLLGEESTHQLSDSTRFKQKLTAYPSVEKSGQFRSVFEGGLVIDLSSTMGLSISLQNKYNSTAGLGLKKSDTVLLTGLNIKI